MSAVLLDFAQDASERLHRLLMQDGREAPVADKGRVQQAHQVCLQKATSMMQYVEMASLSYGKLP